LSFRQARKLGGAVGPDASKLLFNVGSLGKMLGNHTAACNIKKLKKNIRYQNIKYYPISMMKKT
jgi:hypothetical protein